jgi:hypothetical protein
VDEEQTPFLAACLALVQQGGGVQPEADTATTARSSSARPSGSAVESRVRHSFSVQLDAVRTEALLEDVHGPYNTRLEDFLVAALLRAADIVLRDRQVDTLIVRDGRSEWSIPRDQSRVVGCFARTVPLSVELPDPADHASTIRLTKDALRAALQGPPAPAARMPTPDPAQPSLEIVAAFGEFDTSHSEPDNWRVARPLCYLGAETHAPHCVEVFATVHAGSLHIHWSAGAGWTRPDLDRLATRHLDEVSALITHAQSMRSRGFTPGDFPDAGLTQEQLDRFLGGLGE